MRPIRRLRAVERIELAPDGSRRTVRFIGTVCVTMALVACGRTDRASFEAAEGSSADGPVFAPPRSLEHLKSRWEAFEALGPLAVTPVRRSHHGEAWGSDRLGLFAALYPREPFESLEDFDLFTRYTSSIQQFLIRDGDVDLEWFLPETRDEAVATFLTELDSRTRLSGREAEETIRQWELPAEFDWTFELTLREALVDASEEWLELTAEAEQGYLCMFALRE